jgi:hypothetical protein
MITDYDPGAVAWEGGRPARLGDAELGQATRVATSGRGFWGLFSVGDDVVVVHPAGAIRGRAADVADRLRRLAGDEGGAGDDRRVAESFLPFLGGDDPGRGPDAPRSRAEAGGPPTYWLSDQRNAPPAAEPPSDAERAQRRSGEAPGE